MIDKKLWTFFGDMFMKLPTDKTKDLIEKGKIIRAIYFINEKLIIKIQLFF
jgi:hypothetical protein